MLDWQCPDFCWVEPEEDYHCQELAEGVWCVVFLIEPPHCGDLYLDGMWNTLISLQQSELYEKLAAVHFLPCHVRLLLA